MIKLDKICPQCLTKVNNYLVLILSILFYSQVFLYNFV
jgi:hypothetical protein